MIEDMNNKTEAEIENEKIGIETDDVGDITSNNDNIDHKLDNIPNNDGTAQGKVLAKNNPGLDSVGNLPTGTVVNATVEGDTHEGINLNHDVDPYMNQKNANHA